MPLRSSVNRLMKFVLDQMIRPSPKHQTPRGRMLQPTVLSLARFIRVPCTTPMLRVRDISNQSKAMAALCSSPLRRSSESLRRFASANSDTSPQNGCRRRPRERSRVPDCLQALPVSGSSAVPALSAYPRGITRRGFCEKLP
jgi:hypothetical protein